MEKMKDRPSSSDASVSESFDAEPDDLLATFPQPFKSPAQAERRSQMIDAMLKTRKEPQEVTLLLLGGSCNNGTLVLEQMKLVYDRGRHPEELLQHRHNIYKSILFASGDLVKSFYTVWDVECEEACRVVLNSSVDPDPRSPLDPNIADAMQKVWKFYCANVPPKEKEKIRQHDLATQYFFKDLARVAASDYIPLDSDVFYAYYLNEASFKEICFANDDFVLRIIDPQRFGGDWKKWIPSFQNVSLVLYSVNLMCYDDSCNNGGGDNRLRVTIHAFDWIVSRVAHPQDAIILLFENIDTFRSRLLDYPLRNWDTEYNGGDSVDEALKFIVGKFEAVKRPTYRIYPCFMQDDGIANLNTLFCTMREVMLQGKAPG